MYCLRKMVFGLAAAVAVAMISACPARATTIAYDGFGTSGLLNGSTGSANSTGFGAAWSDSANTFSLSGSSLAVPTGYPPVEGGMTSMQTQSMITAYRDFSSPIVKDTYYLAFAYAPGVASSGTEWGFGGLVSEGNKRIVIGNGFVGTTRFWSLVIDSTSGEKTYNLNATIDTSTVLLAAKIVLNDDNTVDMYGNVYQVTDTFPTEEPTTWDMSLTGISVGTQSYDRAFLRAGSSGTTATSWDEYRLGTTWQDIHAVPEPSVLVLLAGGLLGMVAYAWKKRK